MLTLDSDVHEAFEALRKLGLSRYEALAYLHLLISGGANPKSVCDTTGIPYTKVYEVLRKLEKRGWIVKASDKPLIYVAKGSSEIIKAVKEDFEQRIVKAGKILSQLEKAKIKGASVSSILVVRNFDALTSIIKDLFRRAKHEVRAIIATNYMNKILKTLTMPESLKIRVLIRPGIEAPKDKEYRYITGILPLDLVIVDNFRMILSMGRVSDSSFPRIFGIVINDEELINATVEYFESLWQKSKTAKTE
ncbi:MAG: hypothetical protein B6U95_05905 [Thermofilum sp. ex4484_82]|nr:MAG: hypothetical protein B6U95_05905 [Thermofilum sp. ex4484_82]OYT37776.1 MAG: hypothetical protein B6U96_05895 [Archaeoglobales archaeon ex4484_92]